MPVLEHHVVRTEPITLEEYAAELASWNGTRYTHSGQSRKGIDCLGFVVVMMDWLHGWDTSKLPPIPKKPPQTSINDPKTAFHVVQWVADRYPHDIIYNRKMPFDQLDLWPGDLIVVRNQVHPGHAVIAGARKNTCWHSINDISLRQGGNVHETSIGWCNMFGIVQIARTRGLLLEQK